jgi:hypothetical protein
MTDIACGRLLRAVRALTGQLSALEQRCTRICATAQDRVRHQTRILAACQGVTDRGVHQHLYAHREEIYRQHERSLVGPTLRRGQIRLARLPHYQDLGLPLPLTRGYSNILIGATRQAKILRVPGLRQMPELQPAHLIDVRGRYYSNLVAFSRLYRQVACTRKAYCPWEWPSESHTPESEEYQLWRSTGSTFQYPVTHPTSGRYAEAISAWWPLALTRDIRRLDDTIDHYNYPHLQEVMLGWESYSQIDLPLYRHMAGRTVQFRELQQMLDSGCNIQLVLPDGPQIVYDAAGQPVPPYHRVQEGVCGEDGVGSLPINRDVIQELHRLVQDPRYWNQSDTVNYGFSLAMALLRVDWTPVR